MPHVLKMKDGKLLTPFGIRDLLDAVQDYGKRISSEKGAKNYEYNITYHGSRYR